MGGTKIPGLIAKEKKKKLIENQKNYLEKLSLIEFIITKINVCKFI